MSESADDAEQPAGLAADEPLRLDIDCICRTCGYNLRGLDVDGACPECGDSIAESLKVQRYWGADTAEMRHLAAGADLLIWAVLLFVMSPFCIFFAAAAMNPLSFFGATLAVILLLWFATIWVLWIMGILKLITRPVSRAEPLIKRPLAFAAISSSIAGPILLILPVLWEALFGAARLPRPFAEYFYWMSISICFAALLCVVLIAKQFGRQAKCSHITGTASVMEALYVSLYLIVMLLWLPLGVASSATAGLYRYWPALLTLFGVLFLTAVIGQLILLGRLHKQLRPVADPLN